MTFLILIIAKIIAWKYMEFYVRCLGSISIINFGVLL